jgi:peroxiredoxin
MPEVGSKAPEFTLPNTAREAVSLSDFKGKNVVLAFFPGAFTGVCTNEACALRDSMAEFNGMSAEVVGISVDSPFANTGFVERNNLQFPLLSDYGRKAVNDYGIALENFAGLEGYTVAKRAVYVIDGEGTIRYAWVSDNPGVEPNYDEVKAELGKL